MDLGVAGVSKACPALVGPPGGGDIRAASIRREVVDVAVTTGAEENRVGSVGRDLAGKEIAGHDSLGMTIDKDQVKHLGVLVHLDATQADLGTDGRVSPQEELLASLALRIESA